MLDKRHLAELRAFLEGEAKPLRVVVMPDFFLDRLVHLNYDADRFSAKVAEVSKMKGGSIDGLTHTDMRGGNAVNTATALSALGAEVIPIVCTSKLGLQFLKFYLKPYKIDLSHVKVLSKASATTALELETGKGKVNVMLRDVGSLAVFGAQNLDDEDFEAIKNADYICLFNWAGTRRFGTQLAKTVFHYAKTRGKAITYYDTADPSPNCSKIQELIRQVLESKHLDVLSLNENEAICYANKLDRKAKSLKVGQLEDLALEAAKVLAKNLSARIDLHTTSYSATLSKSKDVCVPAFRVTVLRATGAGDAWNAGNIIGEANGLSDVCRLAFANAVAAYYISSPSGKHPSMRQLAKFLVKLKQATS